MAMNDSILSIQIGAISFCVVYQHFLLYKMFDKQSISTEAPRLKFYGKTFLKF